MATAKKRKFGQHKMPSLKTSSVSEDPTPDVVSIPTPITLYDLMIYRDQMSPSQLERYGEYFLNTTPAKPFTNEELEQLKRRKEHRMMWRRAIQAREDCQSAISAAKRSAKEAWELLVTSQLQHWKSTHAEMCRTTSRLNRD